MNKIFLVACLTSHMTMYAQMNEFYVSITDCREGKIIGGVSGFSLYRNDSLYRKCNGFYLFDSIPDGRYYIEYDTYFGKRKSESQYIDKNTFLPSFDVCVDELPEDIRKTTTNLFIDNLKDGEVLPMYRRYSGCFNYSNVDSLAVKKDNGNYYIIRNKKRRKLNQKQIDILRDFEIQMRNIKESHYYSTAWCDTYIGSGKDVITYGAPMGDWEGYEYLLIQLGFVKRRKSVYFKD